MNASMAAPLDAILDEALEGRGPIVWLTGAGISAESGIPTFRGPEGYWRVGSRNYHPEELATQAAFRAMPDEVWAWYRHRLSVCRAAEPNPAHRSLSRLERAIGERCLLVTQNVDGLHLRAGSSLERTYEIHGNIAFMRCAAACSPLRVPVPDHAEPSPFRCAGCGARMRPHVLWFDESYDEPLFRYESSIAAASEAALLVVVGTTGATNLPLRMGAIAARRGAPMIVINPEPNPFSEMAEAAGSGVFLEGRASVWVPCVAEAIAKRCGMPWSED